MPCFYFNLWFLNKIFSFVVLDKTLNNILQMKKFVQKWLAFNVQPSELWGVGIT